MFDVDLNRIMHARPSACRSLVIARGLLSTLSPPLTHCVDVTTLANTHTSRRICPRRVVQQMTALFVLFLRLQRSFAGTFPCLTPLASLLFSFSLSFFFLSFLRIPLASLLNSAHPRWLAQRRVNCAPALFDTNEGAGTEQPKGESSMQQLLLQQFWLRI